MPEQRVLKNFLPGTDAGHRSIDQHEAADALRMLRGKSEADHVADVMRHQIGAFDLERVEHAGDISGLGLLVEARSRLGGQAEPAQIGHHHRVIPHQIGRHRRPHVAGLAIAVQQDDRRALPTDADMDGGAVGGDLLRLEGARKVRNLRDRGGREGEGAQRQGDFQHDPSPACREGGRP